MTSLASKMFFLLASIFHYSNIPAENQLTKDNLYPNPKNFQAQLSIPVNPIQGKDAFFQLFIILATTCFLRPMQPAHKHQGITLKSKSEYSCVQKVLCCKCFSCLQEERVMTSDIRKQTVQRMMEAYLVQNDDKILIDPVKLMILIYVCNDDNIPAKHVLKCKISPSTGVFNYRTDLQFYIPQICNFIVFHRNLQDNYLRDAIQQICKLNFYFAHLYYFYMKSIEKNISKTEISVLKPVVQYNDKLVKDMREHYKNVKCSALDQYIQEYECLQSNSDQFFKGVIKDYQFTKMEYGRYAKVKVEDIDIKVYPSIFQGHNGPSGSFQSTINFFQDLFYLCEDLKNHEKKKEKAIEFVKMMNEHLPASAYVPFSKNCFRLCNILKIVTSEVKIFSTKERAPICLCIEIYCPSEHLNQVQENIFWDNVETPIALKMVAPTKRHVSSRNFQKTAEFRPENVPKRSFNNIMFQEKLLTDCRKTSSIRGELLQRHSYSASVQTELISCNVNVTHNTVDRSPNQSEYNDNNVDVSRKNSEEETKKETTLRNNSKTPEELTEEGRKSYRDLKGFTTNTKNFYMKGFDKMFGESLADTKKRIAKNSVFGNLVSWDILYIIVKTSDDLKQEQFAMQLLHQFDYIFKLEKLPLLLTTYEVLSMGPDRGIIEMVKDSVTFDNLKKTLKKEFPSALSLKDFFQVYFQDKLIEAKENFMKSLAAYCLVMYVIQAKDRHNGNILLHRNGKIFHIDFGFFLSNLPGKGIQLEKDCPFKLLSQHIEVLDGTESVYFKKFREYFFLGFKAIRKHQNKIIMLVKMMYTSGGMSMPCFQKGQATITSLQQRINPQGVTNDSLLNEHCQQLINRSLDNWASKWYDRFQYWAQGIFY